MELLATKGLSVAIGDKLLCRDLDLNVHTGQRWAILGPNGSGKTTLLHTLGGLRPAQGGEVLLCERTQRAWTARERARILGVLLQHYDDPFPSTVLETALIGRHPHLGQWQWEGRHDHEQARAALQMMGLAGFETRAQNTLSGGERRRLAIATLLTQDPRLFLLDEPTNHLDLHHQIQVMHVFSELVLQKSRVMIAVLHDINSAARFCSHALLMFGDGRTMNGTIDNMLTEENLTRLYGHALRCITTPEGTLWTPAYTARA